MHGHRAFKRPVTHCHLSERKQNTRQHCHLPERKQNKTHVNTATCRRENKTYHTTEIKLRVKKWLMTQQQQNRYMTEPAEIGEKAFKKKANTINFLRMKPLLSSFIPRNTCYACRITHGIILVSFRVTSIFATNIPVESSVTPSEPRDYHPTGLQRAPPGQ